MNFNERLEWLKERHEALVNRKNEAIYVNGVYERHKYPILAPSSNAAKLPLMGSDSI